MGGKYYVIARNYDDMVWQYDLYTNSFIKFIGAVIKCTIRYELVDLGVRR